MAEVQESLADIYFSKLKTAPNPGVVLAQFYGTMHGIEVGRSEIIQFGRLVKLFGRTPVFFAVIDITKIETPKEFPFGLLFHICKTKLEKATQEDMALTSMYSLDRRIAELEKEIAKVKKIDPEKASRYLEGE